MLKGNFREDFAELEQQLKLSAEIFNKLPYRKEQKTYLAVFAAMLTGNPHAFDQGTAGGRILYQVVERNLEVRNLTVMETEIFPAYKRQKSYLAAGILLDDVSNYAMLCNVQAVKKRWRHSQGNGWIYERKRYGPGSSWSDCRLERSEMPAAENIYCGKSICFCDAMWKDRAFLHVHEWSAATCQFDAP